MCASGKHYTGVQSGVLVDREQHITQDAAEHYSVYVMQNVAEQLGCAIRAESEQRREEYRAYLDRVGLSEAEFARGRYQKYKANADSQLPAFVRRLAGHLPAARFHFENVEKEYRDRGLKGDFLLTATTIDEPFSVSLKNYIGSGGISRPQVGSGTYASFAHGFIFDRVGVGTYLDPRDGSSFRGADAVERSRVLEYMGLTPLVPLLAELDDCQAQVRAEFLAPDCEFYDKSRVEAAARRVAEKGVTATLDVLNALGMAKVKEVVLNRSGLDGEEEALYFDGSRYVDSITTRRYHDLRHALNHMDTSLDAFQQGQGIRFEFRRWNDLLLSIQVPFTINTNGAWFRPKEKFTGTRRYIDKGHPVDLVWGQRRPHKSKEIATSTNMYVDLSATGIFDE